MLKSFTVNGKRFKSAGKRTKERFKSAGKRTRASHSSDWLAVPGWLSLYITYVGFQSIAITMRQSNSTQEMAWLSTSDWLNLLIRISHQGPVVQNPINDNPRLKVNQGVYFSSPRCCSRLIFGRTLHQKKSILKKQE